MAARFFKLSQGVVLIALFVVIICMVAAYGWHAAAAEHFSLLISNAAVYGRTGGAPPLQTSACVETERCKRLRWECSRTYSHG